MKKQLDFSLRISGFMFVMLLGNSDSPKENKCEPKCSDFRIDAAAATFLNDEVVWLIYIAKLITLP